MTQDIEIPKISQKHLLGIKYLSIDDINKILENAPEKELDFFSVPKVIE